MKKNRIPLIHVAPTPEVTEILLLHGADVNALDNDGETPLHYAITRRKGLSVIDMLLKYGCNINMKNNFGSTPLHCAITDKEGLPVVRKLLKHGANVNATDKHNTVLFLSVKYYRNLEIIKELLEFGADINVRSSSLNRFFTPIDVAIHDGDLSCAQLLIKITVLKNFSKDVRKIADLQSYIKFNNNSKLSDYFNECVLEISHMKMDKVNTFSLFDYVNDSDYVKPLYLSSKFDVDITRKYNIYQEIILERLRPCLQRANLLDKIKNLQIAFESVGISSKSVLRPNVLLNGDCLFKIGEFLSNDDLLNFLIVIGKDMNISDYSLDRYW